MKLAYGNLSTSTLLTMEVELQNIIDGCKQYQKFAQKSLYNKFAPVMNGLCLRYVIDPVIAKKIVQNGFVKVFSNIQYYKNDEEFELWMKKIFIKTVLIYFHKHKELTMDHFPTSETNFTQENNVSPLSITNDITPIDLLGILNKLPVTYRLIFNLICIDKFKHDKISALLSIEANLSKEIFNKANRIVYQELFKMNNARGLTSTNNKKISNF